MPSVTRRRVAVVAILSTVSLLAFSGDASAKSSRAKSRAAIGQAMQAAGAAGLMSGAAGYMSGGSVPRYTYVPPPSGGVLDNTAGWGDVGAR